MPRHHHRNIDWQNAEWCQLHRPSPVARSQIFASVYGQASPSLTAAKLMSLSWLTLAPGATFWLHTFQSRSRIWSRPAPDASVESVKKRGFPDTRWISSCAACKPWPTSFGITNESADGAVGVVEAAVTAAGVSLLVGVARGVAVSVTVWVAVTVAAGGVSVAGGFDASLEQAVSASVAATSEAESMSDRRIVGPLVNFALSI